MAGYKLEKLVTLEEDINTYRLRGQWEIVIELADKLLSKLEVREGRRFARADAMLNLAYEPYFKQDNPADEGLKRRGFHNGIFTIPDNDDEEGGDSGGYNMTDESYAACHRALVYLDDAVIALLDEEPEPEGPLLDLCLEAEVLGCLHDLVTGSEGECAWKVRKAKFGYEAPPPEPRSFAHPYDRVMYAMYWIVTALGHHVDDWDVLACEYMNKAVDFFADQGTFSAPTPTRQRSSTRVDDDQWERWFEFSHFWAALYNARLGNRECSIEIAREYLQRLAGKPVSYRPQPRVAVLGVFIRQLLGLQPLAPPPRPLEGIPKHTMDTISSEVLAEIRSYIPLYESLTTHLLPFPRGEDALPIEKGRHSRVLEAFDWFTYSGMQAEPGESIGEAADRHYRLIEHLYRGTKYTFHSMRLLRYLAHTFTSLTSFFGDNMTADEKIEAEATIESYAFFWNKHLKLKVDLERKKRTNPRLVKDGPPGENGEFPKKRISWDRHRERVWLDAPSGDPVNDQDGNFILPIYLEDYLQKHPNLSEHPAGNEGGDAIIMEEVDGERIVDALGVFFAGVRMSVMNADGNEVKLRKGLEYAETAIVLLKEHGPSCGQDLADLEYQAFKWLGIINSELAQEVRDSQQRRKYQKQALEAMKRARTIKPSSWEASYQRALQLAEAGEISQAIIKVKDSLQENKAHAASWNLLALLFSARKDYNQALRICNIGVKECFAKIEKSSILKDRLAVPTNAVNGRWSWDAVDDHDKIGLINLKLTQVALEAWKNGPKPALEIMKQILRLSRKFFRGTDIPDDAGFRMSTETERSGLAVNGNNGLGEAGDYRPRNRSRSSSFASGTSSDTASPSQTSLGGYYRFRVHDLFVGIWLTSAALYRCTGHFPQAEGAVREAHRLAEEMAQMDALIQRVPSRLYSGISMKKVLVEQGNVRGLLKTKQQKKQPINELVPGFPKWGPVGARIRSVIADVAFEAALIRQARYDKLIQPPEAPKFARYIAPAVRVEAERRLRSWNAQVAAGGLKPSPSQVSLVSLPTPASTVGKASGRDLNKRAMGVPISTAAETGEVAVPPPVQMQVNGIAVGGIAIDVVPEDEQTSKPAAGINSLLDAEEEPLTLSSLIETFTRVTYIDDDHLGARVHLGKLYMQQGRSDFAQNIFERACKSSKARGGGGGRPSWYGGISGRWNWESWRNLSKCLMNTGRTQTALEAIAFAVKIQKSSFARGLECLR
ncbi:hypothetical protein SpCBS45565_g04360 [Spizellomyces sp. 'palustris']|nr:hypothetical protein SpCBS45565_g04360 [Spizellomyces sp. 'palustris']